MAAVGGNPIEASVAGRIMQVAGDSPADRKSGGRDNEFAPNGDGRTGRVIQKSSGWKITLKISIDDDQQEFEYLEGLKNAGTQFAFSYTEASTAEFGNDFALITGELVRSADSATADVTFEGPGTLERQ